MMEFFVKKVNDLQLLPTFIKISIREVWQGPRYSSTNNLNFPLYLPSIPVGVSNM